MTTPTAAEDRANLDWTRDPPPAAMTQFQRSVRDVDWAQTSFGAMNGWSRELRQMTRLMMADTSPTILYWGSKCSVLYNEAYIPLVGDKHPRMLGMNAPDVFPEFWSFFDHIITRQRRTGETSRGEAEMLLMQRHGFLEETYFDWKLVPVIGEDGRVQGSYGTPTDLTKEVIGQRRTACIRHLTRLTAEASSTKDLWKATLDGLQSNEKDIPFTLLYSVEEQTGVAASPSKPHYTCHLEGLFGAGWEHVIAKEYMDVQYDLDGFAPTMLEALNSDSIIKLEADDKAIQDLLKGIGWKGYGLPCVQFAVVPVKHEKRIAAFMIVGLNPYRRFNQMYIDFLQLAADVVAPQISKLRLAEEIQRRDNLAMRAALDFKRSEMRFTRFAERSIAGLAVTDTKGKVLYANDAWYKFFDLDPKNNYISWVDSVVSEDVALLSEWLDKVSTDKQGGTFQIRSKQPFRQGKMHSESRTAICACYADLNEVGDVESVMVLVMDISELKWIEQQLVLRSHEVEESEAKYRNYAEHCPLGICRTDGEGYVQYGNDAWHSYFDFVRGEVRDPQPWLPSLHDDDVESCKNFFASLLKNPGPFSIELRFKDRRYTISEGDRTVTDDAYILSTGFSEFKSDGTVDHINFWVMEISPQKMAAKVMGEKMEEAIRLKTHQEHFIDMISHEIRNPLSAVLHCGEEVVEAMKTCFSALESSLKMAPDVQLHHVLSEQLHNALDAANTILYCVQHQRQIVDDVLSLSKLDADLLVVAPVPVQPMELVNSSLRIFEPELKMTEITLSVRQDRSLAEHQVEWVLLDPNRFLQIVINLVTNAIKFTKTSAVRKIVVTVSASTSPPPGQYLGVDYVPRRYRQATPPTSPGNPSFAASQEQELYLSFRVRDTGAGLTEGEKAQLFNRFAQASPKTHIEYGGSGLGLFISRQITEMLGGEIGMASTAGQGSVFAFYVKTGRTRAPKRSSTALEPIVQLTRNLSVAGEVPAAILTPESRPTTPPTNSAATMAGPRVLVVEDNLVNQKVLCKQLRNKSFVVEAANHGKEALDALLRLNPPAKERAQFAFDVVLCDIEMPIMDGIAFTKEVRLLEAKGRLPGHIPIIGVTANVRSTQVQSAIEAGMDGVTTKPYRIQELISHIDRVRTKCREGR